MRPPSHPARQASKIEVGLRAEAPLRAHTDPAGGSEPSWLGAWRHEAPLGMRLAFKLRREIRSVAFLGEPGWTRAARGDAAEACGLALRLLASGGRPLQLDLALDAVLVAFLDGDAAAGAVVEHARRRAAALLLQPSEGGVGGSRTGPQPAQGPVLVPSEAGAEPGR